MSIDLRTTYLGLSLKNPLIASASPLTGNLERLQKLEAAGVSAVVLPSLFEEQIEHDQLEFHRVYQYQTESYAESLSLLPDVDFYQMGPAASLGRVAEAKRQLSIPVIASLNGHTEGGWTRYAEWMQEAGADAIELNAYFVPTDCHTTGEQVAQKYEDLVRSVRETVSIPLSVKIGSQFTSIPSMARRLLDAGADGLVLFNRFLEPDIDLETLTYQPDLVLSSHHEMRLTLRWIAILRDQLSGSLAATSGIHTAEDMVKLLLAGADTTMVAACLLRHGPDYAKCLLDDLTTWLEENEYESVKQMQGSMSLANCPDPSDLGRANYMQALRNYTTSYLRG